MKKLDKRYPIKPLPTAFSGADTLKDTLRYYGITQAQLANHLGVSAPYVSAILSRKKFMSSEFALRIELATGISADLLMKMDLAYQLENKRKELFSEIEVEPFEWLVTM